MKLIGPERYELRFSAERFQVSSPSGGQKLSALAQARRPKLYVVARRGSPIYVGTTNQPIRTRLRQGWTADGLWHVTNRRSSSAPHSAWYGQVATGNIDTGGINGGFITSPSLTLGSTAWLRFDYFNASGCASTACATDRLWVDIRRVGESTWTGVVELAGNTAFAPFVQSLTAWGGQPVQIRFRFDSVISTSGSNFEGPYVDNVRITPQ